MKLIDAEEAVGRVVRAVQQGDNDEQIVIVFADETFLSLRSRRLDDDTEIEVQTHFNPMEWQFPDLEEAFGRTAAMAMHQAEVERRETDRLRWLKEKRERLQRELRALDGQT